jgi:hypothetical protein
MSDSKPNPRARPATAKRRDPIDLPPIFVHSEVDDLGLTTNAFRVYAHLARRAGKDNSAWPSYSTIGEHCFRASYPKAQEATLRRRAMEAVRELEERGLIEVEHRRRGDQGHTSNEYRLLTLRERRELLVQREREQGKTQNTESAFQDVPF